jgi:hypothetical protein
MADELPVLHIVVLLTAAALAAALQGKLPRLLNSRCPFWTLPALMHERICGMVEWLTPDEVCTGCAKKNQPLTQHWQ